MTVELDHRLFTAIDYAVLNPMQVGKQAYSDLPTIRLLPKGLERHERFMPRLVHLSALKESHRIELLERTHRWAKDNDMPLFSALLISDIPANLVRLRLEARMLLRRPDGSRVWLRYHDPRVFQHLRWLLDEVQLATLMGPATCWIAYDPLTGQWWRQDRPDVQVSANVQFTNEQWRSIDQFESLNRCLRDVADEGVDTGPETAKHLLDGLLAAQAQGLTHSDDIMLYAKQCFAHGLEIPALPQVARRLRQVQEQGMSYASACTDLREEDFRQLPDKVSTRHMDWTT